MDRPDMTNGTVGEMQDGYPIADAAQAAQGPSLVIVVDSRALARECLSFALTARHMRVLSTDTVAGCLALIEREGPAVVLLCGTAAAAIRGDLQALAEQRPGLHVLALCDSDDPDTVIEILEAGARGCVPATSGLNVLVGAVGLVQAGGTYVPSTSLIAARRAPEARPAAEPQWQQMFTARQAAIVDAIRRGKPNKIIAFELGMCESTVKVHVRNVMKKLKARNRTELAFKANELRIAG